MIIVAAPPTAVAANFALGQAGKREFAPIVLLLLEDARNPRRPRRLAGLHRLYGRKLDRERLRQNDQRPLPANTARRSPCCAPVLISKIVIDLDR